MAESAIVARDVQLARHTGSRVHVAHVSTAESVEVIRWAKNHGIAVTAEVLRTTWLSALVGARLRSGLQSQPPLRPREDQEALREALADGTIDAVATDHARTPGGTKEHALRRRPSGCSA